MTLEGLDQLEEVEHRAGEPINLVDQDHVDFAGFNISQQALKGRALQRASGDSTIVVAILDRKPPLGALTYYIGLAGLALGIQRVELHIEAFLGRLAGVDRATQFAHHRRQTAARKEFLTVNIIAAGTSAIGAGGARPHVRL